MDWHTEDTPVLEEEAPSEAEVEEKPSEEDKEDSKKPYEDKGYKRYSDIPEKERKHYGI